MKNWLPNSLILLYLGSSSMALSGPLEEAHLCLEQVDLRCAMDARDILLRKDPTNAQNLRLHARTLFHQGLYAEALKVVEQLEENGGQLDDGSAFPLRATATASRGMVESRSVGVVVRHDPGVDRILAEEAVQTLSMSRTVYDLLFGAGPDHDLVMDIFPTAKRFMEASGLPPEAVRTTGVIALSKWNRLLLTSPRALARGYAWKDTAAHEYIHLVVSWRSEDQAPVWLQEGLAKYLEAAWRGERIEYLSSHQQSLLAAALRNDEFVPFEKFAQSMAYLDSGEEAALAFAQVATMVAFLQHRSSDEVFPILMDRLRSGEEAETAVASLAGFASFEEFTVEWKQYVAGLPLISEQLLALPVVLDGEGSEFSDDPLLHNRLDLAKFVRLGDLLMEAQRPKAALIEYEKAKDGSQPVSPSVLVRKSLCHLQLGQPQQALDIAEQAVKIYPEHSVILTTLAALYEQLDREDLALLYWQRAHELNPYEIATQEALIRLYQLRDEADLAQKHMSYAQILSRGGAFTAPTQSPTKHGESNAQ